jgi:hypothetical protein
MWSRKETQKTYVIMTREKKRSLNVVFPDFGSAASCFDERFLIWIFGMDFFDESEWKMEAGS